MDKTPIYQSLLQAARALLEAETDPIANAANLSALLFNTLPDLNWAGVYILRQTGLVLGPFQGKPACVRIALGKGVCGTAAAQQKTVLVKDVHAFAGHIACDAASNSEIVVPIIKEGKLWGVLDIDSPLKARFDETDQHFLEQLADLFARYSHL